jgi:hypothetical protein
VEHDEHYEGCWYDYWSRSRIIWRDGTFEEILKSTSLTAKYLNGEAKKTTCIQEFHRYKGARKTTYRILMSAFLWTFSQLSLVFLAVVKVRWLRKFYFQPKKSWIMLVRKQVNLLKLAVHFPNKTHWICRSKENPVLL